MDDVEAAASLSARNFRRRDQDFATRFGCSRRILPCYRGSRGSPPNRLTSGLFTNRPPSSPAGGFETRYDRRRFGCGVGATTRMLAEMVGPSGHVTGVDVSPAQLEQGRGLCNSAGVINVTFAVASAMATGLPRNSFDLVYCRFLLLHWSIRRLAFVRCLKS